MFYFNNSQIFGALDSSHHPPAPARKITARSAHSPAIASTGRSFLMCSANDLISDRRDGRPMSENTIRVALRSMGYGNENMTAHGFRSMASTTLNEHGWPVDVIERQLAHADKNAVRAAYNHAEYLPQRRDMMQWWADFLDETRESQ